MRDYYSKALMALRGELKTKVVMRPMLIDLLEIPAGGFMTTAEAQSVRDNGESQMGCLIEILQSKGDTEFHTFCEMLQKSNHCSWANKLKHEAEKFRTKDHKEGD